MKGRKMIRTALLLFLVGTSTQVFSHGGGHYHQADVLNTWLLKSNKVIEGNFSFGDSISIVLEQREGKFIKIQISDLSLQDQKLAIFKIKKLELVKKSLHPSTNGTLQDLRENAYNTQRAQIFNLSISSIFILISISIVFIGVRLIHKTKSFNRKVFIVNVGFILLVMALIACKKSTDTVISFSKTRTSFIDSAFTAFKPAVATRWDNDYFYVSSNGFPTQNVMVGITNWQQQVPIPQFYTGNNSWSIPLQPVYASNPLSTQTNLMKGAIAIAVDGIPIFNALNNRGEDSYLIGELDNFGGHCGKADDYHYHAAPLHLALSSNKPIAFALDGFPVYGNKEPDGSSLQSLDICHGHMGVDGLYHYHGTTSYPYVIGAMRGKVSLDPNTTAPENQIIPQANSSPLRPATSPLNGAKIIGFVSVGSNSYKLTYQIGSKLGYVEYSWNNANLYTYKLTDTAGIISISTYQR